MSDVAIGLSLFAFLMLSYWLVRVLGGDTDRQGKHANATRHEVQARAHYDAAVAPSVRLDEVAQRTHSAPPPEMSATQGPETAVTQTTRNSPVVVDAPVSVQPSVQSSIVKIEFPSNEPPQGAPAAAIVAQADPVPAVKVSVIRDSNRPTAPSSLARPVPSPISPRPASHEVRPATKITPEGAAASSAARSVEAKSTSPAAPSVSGTLPPNYIAPGPVSPPPAFATDIIALPKGYERAVSARTIAPPQTPAPAKPVVAYEPLPPLPVPRSAANVQRDPPVIVAPSIAGTLAAAAVAATATAPAAAAVDTSSLPERTNTSTLQNSSESMSPRSLLASSLPRSSATEQRPANAQPQTAEPSRAEPPTEPSATAAGVRDGDDPDRSVLVSLQRRGTRVVGADANADPVFDLMPAQVPRPQAPSIWDSTRPRRRLSDDEILAAEILTGGQAPAVKAERIAVRAEPLLVRPDVRSTLAPGATLAPAKPKSVASVIGPISAIPDQKPASVGTAGGYAISQVQSGSEAPSSIVPNVRYTMPPGALGEE